MQSKHWFVVCVLVVAVCGCEWKQHNPDFCPPGPGCPLPPDPEKCGTSGMVCPEAMPLCLNDMTCVECIGDKGCTAPRFCSAQNTCIECTTHEDCSDSKLCLEGGTCALPEEVAYVDGSASASTTCTQDKPCANLEDALNATPARKYIKVAGMVLHDKAALIEGREVAIYGVANAQLDRTNNGPILHVRGPTATLSVYDLALTGQGGTAAQDAAIRLEQISGNPTLTLSRVKVFDNAGRGILADGGSLTVDQSSIFNNALGGLIVSGGRLTLTRSTISSNAAGGVLIAMADFDITNNVIVKNGSASSNFGGVKLDSISGARMPRFEFNTVALNTVVTGGVAPGVACTAVATPIDLKNSIVYDNGLLAQVEGNNCTWSYSDIGPMAAPGTRNINAAPMFVGQAVDNYHLQSGSPAKDAADPGTMVKIDIDGDDRPQGTAPDMGADELR